MPLEQQPRSTNHSSARADTAAAHEPSADTLQEAGALMLRRLASEGAHQTPASFANALARAEIYGKAKYDDIVALHTKVELRGELRWPKVHVYAQVLEVQRNGADATQHHKFVDVEIPGSPFDDMAGSEEMLYERLARGLDSVGHS